MKKITEYECTGKIKCPWCEKISTFSYNAKGKSSSKCANCRKLVMWDFDKMTSEKI
jgi:sarcosine oxidase delta subunit